MTLLEVVHNVFSAVEKWHGILYPKGGKKPTENISYVAVA